MATPTWLRDAGSHAMDTGELVAGCGLRVPSTARRNVAPPSITSPTRPLSRVGSGGPAPRAGAGRGLRARVRAARRARRGGGQARRGRGRFRRRVEVRCYGTELGRRVEVRRAEHPHTLPSPRPARRHECTRRIARLHPHAACPRRCDCETSARVGYRLGLSLLRTGRPVEAIEVANAVLKRYPAFARIRTDVIQRAWGYVRA